MTRRRDVYRRKLWNSWRRKGSPGMRRRMARAWARVVGGKRYGWRARVVD